MLWAKFVTRAIGTYSTAPVEAFVTTGVIPTERCFGIITPVTPLASAVRKIEPKLCGSSKLSKISKKGASSEDVFVSKSSNVRYS